MSFKVSIDISKVAGLAEKLSTFDGDEFGRVALNAVNAAADEVYKLVVPRINATVNLSDEYVKQRMMLEYGTNPDRPVARIVATGSRPTMTQLVRYDARQETQANRWVRSDRKGDASRGIPKGMKQAGVSVEVKRGSRKLVAKGNSFLIQLNNDNGFGIATRTGPGKDNFKVRYGPSVYQLFKVAAAGVLDEATDILEDKLLAEANRLIAFHLADSI